MIPRECKRLIEVDFPIAVVSKHAVREKSIRHGHPSTLHLWWARRPLAACRAVLMGLLLPDPCDEWCPAEFRDEARELLLGMRGRPQRWNGLAETNEGLRRVLLDFIGDFANWDHAAEDRYLEVGRGLVKAAHPEETPLVVDPFAGGGSIPLEALRLGCDAFASDLNPVACLILKVMLEDIPRHGPGLADELRRVGKEIKEAAEKELAGFYPVDPDGSRPIAYLWARTVRCEAPGCGAEIPLVRSFWLSKKANRQRALRWRVVRDNGRAQQVAPLPSEIRFEVFTPERDSEVPGGTVSRARATCLACGAVLAPERVRAQLAAQHGGADVKLSEHGQRVGGAMLLAVVTLSAEERGRKYRLGTESDYQAVQTAMRRLEGVAAASVAGGLSPVPDEPLPPIGTLGFRVQRYGMVRWGDLFTRRQSAALLVLVRLLQQGADTPNTIAAILVSRFANGSSSLCRWNPNPSGFAEKIEATFSRQALPLVWDFAETSPIHGTSGDIKGGADWLAAAAEHITGQACGTHGQASVADASRHPLPDEAAGCWFTDPPYYDAIPYSDLSDFFFVWLKRALPGHPLLRDPDDPSNPLTPKTQEIVQDETKTFDGRPKDRAFFEAQMGKAFAEGRRVLRDDGVGCVVFAHKTTEGWEALLTGLIRGGWVITASWPIATEMGTRLRARESAALATSVHLVCRPRTTDETGDWAAVARELPGRVRSWMERLEGEGIRGADLVFACIGPALEIYSRYAKVVDAEDREIPLGGDPEALEPHRRGYLAYVWETVARVALEQVLGTAEGTASADALEEDARLTALFLWTLQSTNGEAAGAESAADEEAGDQEEEEDEAPRTKKKSGFALVYDVARRFAQPLGIHLDAWEGRVVAVEKGVVRLLPIAERARQLFGEEGADAVAAELENEREGPKQMRLFAEAEVAPRVRGRGRRPGTGEGALETRREATTLDRLHAAMLLQRAGRTHALRALLVAEQERGPDFLRLANSLSALYPRSSEEKRLLDAMLLAVPRG